MPSIALVALRLFIKEAQSQDIYEAPQWWETATVEEVEQRMLSDATGLLAEHDLDGEAKAV